MREIGPYYRVNGAKFQPSFTKPESTALTVDLQRTMLSFQIWRRIRPGGAAEERDEGVDGNAEGLAERAQEEPLPDQGREDHAGDHHEDDVDAGVHLVRERAAASEKGEQNDLGAEKQDRRRRRRGPHGLGGQQGEGRSRG